MFDALLPLVDALNAVNGENPQVVDPLLEHLIELVDIDLLLLPLLDDVGDLLQAALPRVDGGHHLLHQGGLLCHL